MPLPEKAALSRAFSLRAATQAALFFLGGALAIFLMPAQGAAAQDADTSSITIEIELREIEVVGVTPVGGGGLERRLVPANVQIATGEDIERLRPLGITDFMQQALGSVHLSNLGSNPFQPDVVYRGFRGSPLLGLPQGIAVYQDGARVNETFGDVVNWDLIPESAIASIELVPGSNPLYGLNALGGALSLQTKSGFTHAGYQGSAYGGSFGRFGVDAQAGGTAGDVGVFVAGEAFREDGWRDFSASETYQAFGKMNYVRDQTALELGLTLARDDLRGNGAVPVELLSQDRNAVFTYPDNTQNTMGMLTLQGTHQLSPVAELSGVVYGRLTNTETFNGDDSDYGACPDGFDAVGFPDADEALCFGGDDDDDDEEGEEDEDESSEDGEGEDVRQIFDQSGNPVPFGSNVATATQNTTDTRQRSLGVQLQATVRQPLLGNANHFVFGGSADGGWVDFESQTELGRLTDERGTVGSGLIDFGLPGSGDAFGSRTAVQTQSRTASLFFSNTFSVTPALGFTLSGRYNYANVELDDQLGTALNGNHRFYRFNPAVGLTYQIAPAAGLFAQYSTSNRAPTPVELTCADPEAPCRLPNGFQADPPLDQAVATTFNGGVRGQVAGVNYSVGLFRTDTDDDIYFISAGPARNSGFFDNIGTTRRQGVEASLRGARGPVSWYSSYTYLDATFQDALMVNSPQNPEAENGEIQVEEGDRLPLTPRHLLKLGGDVRVLRSLSLGAGLVYNGEQYLRGDEGNLLAPIDRFTILDLRASYDVARSGLVVYAKASNVLGNEYATAGLLGEPDEVAAFEDFENPRFLTPGQPRALRLGVEYSF